MSQHASRPRLSWRSCCARRHPSHHVSGHVSCHDPRHVSCRISRHVSGHALSRISCLDAPLITTMRISRRVFLGDPVTCVVTPRVTSLVTFPCPCRVSRNNVSCHIYRHVARRPLAGLLITTLATSLVMTFDHRIFITCFKRRLSSTT